MIFLMQSKTFPSYISENSVCAILTQILRELMKVKFFFYKRLHRKFFTLLILYSANKTVGMPKTTQGYIKNMRFDESLLIFVFDIRCFDIKPKTYYHNCELFTSASLPTTYNKT